MGLFSSCETVLRTVSFYAVIKEETPKGRTDRRENKKVTGRLLISKSQKRKKLKDQHGQTG